MAVDNIKQMRAKRQRKMALLLVLLLAGGFALWRYEGQKSSKTEEADTGQASNSKLASEPDRDADIYGMVTAVKGNQLTILEFDPSTMPGAKTSGSSSSEQSSGSGNAISLGTSSSGMPGKMPSGGPGGFGGSSSSTRKTKLEELKKTSIGTATVTVPVGIPIIVQSSSSADGQISLEAGNLSDLSSDTVVILWLKADSTGQEAGEAAQSVAAYINVTGKVEMDKSTNK